MNRVNIRGSITDEFGRPISSVHVSEKGTYNGTVTNAEGNYSMDLLDQNNTIQISHVGFEAKEFTYFLLPNTIELKETMESIDEIVIQGSAKPKPKKSNLLRNLLIGTGLVAIVKLSSSNVIKGLPKKVSL